MEKDYYTNFRMNMASFESFRRVDVYGFAMVMWETVRRCMTHDGVEVSCLSLLIMMRMTMMLITVQW